MYSCMLYIVIQIISIKYCSYEYFIYIMHNYFHPLLDNDNDINNINALVC